MPVCYTSFSQQKILNKKSKIKKRIGKYYLETNLKYTFTETDKKLTCTLTDFITLPATIVYYFNEQDRCEKEETIFYCDSCMQKGMLHSLSNKFIKWKKVGPTSYYAAFPNNALMEQVKINDQFILRFTRMKRKDINH